MKYQSIWVKLNIGTSLEKKTTNICLINHYSNEIIISTTHNFSS